MVEGENAGAPRSDRLSSLFSQKAAYCEQPYHVVQQHASSHVPVSSDRPIFAHLLDLQ